jgi:hypothetical protein
LWHADARCSRVCADMCRSSNNDPKIFTRATARVVTTEERLATRARGRHRIRAVLAASPPWQTGACGATPRHTAATHRNPSTQPSYVGRCAASASHGATGTTRSGSVLLLRANLATAPRPGHIPSPSARVPYSPRSCGGGDRRGAGTCSFSLDLQVDSVVVNGLVMLLATCLRLCSARLAATGCPVD